MTDLQIKAQANQIKQDEIAKNYEMANRELLHKMFELDERIRNNKREEALQYQRTLAQYGPMYTTEPARLEQGSLVGPRTANPQMGWSYGKNFLDLLISPLTGGIKIGK